MQESLMFIKLAIVGVQFRHPEDGDTFQCIFLDYRISLLISLINYISLRVDLNVLNYWRLEMV